MAKKVERQIDFGRKADDLRGRVPIMVWAFEKVGQRDGITNETAIKAYITFLRSYG